MDDTDCGSRWGTPSGAKRSFQIYQALNAKKRRLEIESRKKNRQVVFVGGVRCVY